MKRNTMKTLKILCTLCFTFLLAGVCSLWAKLPMPKAAASTVLLSTEYKTEGASVRVFRSKRNDDGTRSLVTTDRQGIRFHVQTGAGYEVAAGTPLVDVEAEKNELNDSYKLAEGYKTYTLVIPTRLLQGELTKETVNVLAIETSEYWYSDADGNWESIAYIYNIPDNMYTDALTYRGIICKVEGETETLVAETEMAERSLAYVAKRAYNDTIADGDYWGSPELDEQAAPLIKNFVPTYSITYKDASGNELGTEEVLWGDAPASVPTNEKGTWYDTTGSEEVDVTKTMDFTQNRTLTLTTTSAEEFVLTGVAAHSHSNGYDGVKMYATLPVDKFADGTELDIHAVNVTHTGNGTYKGLAGVWAMKESDGMRLFFGFKEGTALTSGDKLTISEDSVFYANGVMYKLTKEYTIDYDGVDYGMFLGYLNNAHVKAIYNAAEDATGNGGDPNDFTIRVEFYEDIMITDSYVFKHPDSTQPVEIRCGQDASVVHPISGGEYYWVEDENQPDGYTKILELIATGEHKNYAYGKHKGDELVGLAGTMLVQNGGYYIFEDEMYAYFLPTADAQPNGVVEGVWTVGTESGAYGKDEFAKTGEYVANDTEVRFITQHAWFDTADGAGKVTLENMSATAENAVYHTSVDGEVTGTKEIYYHGYNDHQNLGIRGIPTPQAGDTITIVGGTRFWHKQQYYVVGDLVGEERTKDVVFCYNGDYWFSGYDASNNVTAENADVGGMDTNPEHNGEIRLWFDGSAKQVLNATLPGYMIIDPRTPAIYNDTQISGLNTAFYYSSANDMVALITGVTAAKVGDYFLVPKGSAWWTMFYGEPDPVNRAVIFSQDVEATYNGSAWVKGDYRATLDYVENHYTISGTTKGRLYLGNSYTFSVTPASGYVVSKVYINGISQPLADSYTFTAQETNVVEVETVFGYNVTFDVATGATVDSGAIVSGMVKPMAQGDTFTFTVAANEGYKITGVTGAADNGNGTYTVTADGHKTVAIATEKLYKVTYSGANTTASAAGIGSVSNGFSTWVDNGTSVTFTIEAASGYVLTAVSGATDNGNGTYTATVNGADVTVTTTTVATSSLTDANDLIGIENRSSWAGAEDAYCFGATYTNGTNGYLNTTSDLSCYWNDNAGKASLNNGVDVMEYIYINDTSTRTLITKNANGETSYKASTTFPLSMGGCYAPISIESTTGSGIWIRIMKDFVADLGGTFTITIKAGFMLPDEHGNILYVSEDISYRFENGTLTKILNANKIDATDLIGIENRSSWAGTEDAYCFGATYTNGTNGYLNTTSDLSCYWNDNAGKASLNNGVDVMEYIYINDTSTRTLITKNANGETSYKASTTFPLSMGGCYAPISIESTTGSGIWIRIMKDFVADLGGTFTITIKAGFTILDEQGNQLLVKSDISYDFINNTLVKK